ncbi:PspC domain-containing protein [Fusibacter paucivorans]|uniref:PspC domain-containing protein n=1 Tax=Fusibacter paucivorans TaxID=76009 RepID=A0ABS5PTK7_9FIRM|nr:PspC domain-containing protein [Fusibacter paucivorans]MBS7527719.1 PspC domain-containing protein [Fusibacter paucivorans]
MAKNKLCKIRSEGRVSGVCAGLADYFNIDVTIIRLIFVLTAFFGVGSPIVIYIVLAIVLPEYDPDSVDFEEVYDDDDDERY